MPELISRACILCGSDRKETVLPSTLPREERIDPDRDYACTSIRHREHWQIVRCRQCSFVYADPRADDEAITDGYEESEDELYIAEEQGRVVTFKRVCRQIMAHKPSGKILDIGCSIGTFLQVCREQGFEVYGCDLSRWSVNYAREKKGLNHVHWGTPVSTGKFEEGSFDVITMLDLVEHMVDPITELENARKYLKPDGLLVMGTMNVDSWFVKILRGNWPWYMKMHIYYFSPKTIDTLLQRSGYQTKHIVNKYAHCISVRYANHKLQSYLPRLGRVISPILRWTGLENRVIPIDFGDFMTVFATPK